MCSLRSLACLPSCNEDDTEEEDEKEEGEEEEEEEEEGLFKADAVEEKFIQS